MSTIWVGSKDLIIHALHNDMSANHILDYYMPLVLVRLFQLHPQIKAEIKLTSSYTHHFVQIKNTSVFSAKPSYAKDSTMNFRVLKPNHIMPNNNGKHLTFMILVSNSSICHSHQSYFFLVHYEKRFSRTRSKAICYMYIFKTSNQVK